MPKIVINNCYGGFGLSDAGRAAFAALKGWTTELVTIYGKKQRLFIADSNGNRVYDFDIPRDDPDLAAVVETLGDDVNDEFARLKVVEVPDGVAWQLEEYDGNEWVSEVHQTWG